MGFTDPRDLGGDIAGPGGPRDRGQVVMDASRAILPTGLEVCAVDDTDPPLLAALITGRVNQSTDQVRVMVLLNADAAAAIVSEIVGCAARDIDGRRAGGPEEVGAGFGAQFRVALDALQEALRDV
jgi:hypothetical protein